MKATSTILVTGCSCRAPHGVTSFDALQMIFSDRAGHDNEIAAGHLTIWTQENVLRIGSQHVQRFHPERYRLSRAEAERLDPAQRLLLTLCWEALEDAGIDPLDGTFSRTGVYIGQSPSDWSTRALTQVTKPSPLDGTGAWNAVGAGRIAYLLGAGGPTLTLDTACSSALVALHAAARDLRSGAIDRAIVASTNLITGDQQTEILSAMGALSDTHQCSPFGPQANGYVRAEGGGALILERPTQDARRPQPYAILRGTSVNHDGRSNGLTAPSARAQEAVIRQALEDAQLEPSDIDLIEAHGTGTPLGDPIEWEALGNVYGDGDQPCVVGAVKGWTGHLESAAGFMGVARILWSLGRGVTLPQPWLAEGRSDRCPPEGRLILPDTPHQGPFRFGAVSAFGLSGSNAHAIFEAVPSSETTNRNVVTTPVVVPISAPTVAGGQALLAEWTQQLDGSITASQVASSSHRRAHEAARAVAIVPGDQPWQDTAKHFVAFQRASKRDKLALVFPDHDSELWRHREALRRHCPAYETVVAQLEEHLSANARDPHHNDLNAADRSALSFVHAMGLFAQLQEWGLSARCVMGHGVGDLVAACAAGVFSMRDGVALATAFGRAQEDSALRPAFIERVSNTERQAPTLPWCSRQTGHIVRSVDTVGSEWAIGEDPKAPWATCVEAAKCTTLVHIGSSREERITTTQEDVSVLRVLTDEDSPLLGLRQLVGALWCRGHSPTFDAFGTDATVVRLPHLPPCGETIPVPHDVSTTRHPWSWRMDWQPFHLGTPAVGSWTTDDLDLRRALEQEGLPTAQESVKNHAMRIDPSDDTPHLSMAAKLAHARAEGARLWVLTEGATHCPRAAAAWGFAASLEAEHGEHWGGIVDGGGSWQEAVHLLGQAPRARARQGKDERPFLAPAELPNAPNKVHIGPSMVLGGTGAIGSACVSWLLQQGLTPVHVASRTPQTSSDPRIIHHTVNLTEPGAMEALLRHFDDDTMPETFIHAAGTVVRDDTTRPLAEEWSTLEQVHVASLEAISAHASERTRVLYIGSVACLWGGDRLASYGAAKAGANAVVARERATGKPWSCLHLGPWQEGGLVSPAERERYATQGLHPVTPEALYGALSSAIAVSAEHIIAPLDVPNFAMHAQARRPRPFLSRLRRDKTPDTARVPTHEIQALVREQAKKLLGRLPKDSEGLFDAGFDSLLVVELARRLSEALGRPIPPHMVFDHPSIDALTTALQGTTMSAPAMARPTDDDPVVVVSMGCRFPDADGPAEYADRLLQGVSALRTAPEGRGHFNNEVAGFLNDIARFDPTLFGISNREAAAIDPQQRMLLDVTRHTLQALGDDVLRGESVGVFVGVGRSEYWQRLQPEHNAEPHPSYAWSATGNASSFAAGRIAHQWGLTGPTLTIDTACSSSLVALHLATQALKRAECTAAIVGGANTIIDPEGFRYLHSVGALSPTGQCAPFRANANGYVRGEGCGVLLVTTLSEARRRSWPVLACVHGTAIGHDGAAASMTVPNGTAQERVVRAALADAGKTPSQVSFVETHGTGTSLGDPIELAAIGRVHNHRESPLLLGTIKANIGHLEAAAGVASVIHVIMAMRQQMLPPSIDQGARTSQWPDDLPAELVSEQTPWTGEVCAGVSAFGLSGTNAHVVLGSPPEGADIPWNPPDCSTREAPKHWLDPRPQGAPLWRRRWDPTPSPLPPRGHAQRVELDPTLPLPNLLLAVRDRLLQSHDDQHFVLHEGPQDAATAPSIAAHAVAAFLEGVRSEQPSRRLALSVGDVPEASVAVDADWVWHRHAMSYVPSLHPIDTEAHVDALQPSGRWLVTGGRGAIGRVVGEWLTKEGVEVVTAGRTPHDGSISWGHHATCDLTDADQRAALLKSHGPFDGAVHCAGTVEAALLHDQTLESVEALVETKVSVARWLAEEVPGPLILFGSATAWFGRAGQSVYAAANAALEGLAAERDAPGRETLCIAWGPWQLGMAAGMRLKDGAQAMTAVEGIEALQRAWTQRPSCCAFAFRPSSFLGSRADRATWLRPWRREGGASANRAEDVAAQVARVAADVLGANAPLDVSAGFADAGLDSIMAVELSERLARETGLALPATAAFDHPRVDKLARHIESLLRPKAQKVRHAERQANVDEPLAVVGLALRLPGASDANALWQLLLNGERSIVPVPESRWPIEAVPAEGRQGGFLDDIDLFDPERYGISAREAASIDPQQRLLLDVCAEALERGGDRTTVDGSATGVFVGIADRGYLRRFREGTDGRYPDAWSGTGNEPSFAAGRIAHALGLEGPAVALNTTCSSSLVALDLARKSLQSGECERALVGAVHLILSPDETSYLAELGALSPSGACQSFDARADGYVRSEGCAALVVRRLTDAQREGDTILAVVRSTATNHDGRASGLTVPNGEAQTRVLQAAWSAAGITGADLGLLEAHGTGTTLGDPIELQALQRALAPTPREEPLVVRSIKANLGHCELAAGMTGLIGAILCLHHGRIPALPAFGEPNPKLPLDGLLLPREATAWSPGDRPRLAGVSSFGLSGTNAHVVLEEPPRAPTPTSDDAQRVAFVFTGQGSQYVGMAKGLAEQFPAFGEAFERCIVLAEAEGCALRRALNEPELLVQTQYTQPALFALGYGLCTLWASWGVTPNVVAGHSVGEWVAMAAAEVLSLEDAMRGVVRRGRLIQSLPGGGAMMAIRAPEQDVLKWLKPGIQIATVNHAQETVVSGDADAIEALAEDLRARGTAHQALRVSHAFHSDRMEPILEAWRDVVESLQWRTARLPVLSALRGDTTCEQPEHWVRHLREPVHWIDVGAQLTDTCDVVIELGPHPVLTRALQRNPQINTQLRFIPGLTRGIAPVEALNEAKRAAAHTKRTHAAGLLGQTPPARNNRSFWLENDRYQQPKMSYVVEWTATALTPSPVENVFVVGGDEAHDWSQAFGTSVTSSDALLGTLETADHPATILYTRLLSDAPIEELAAELGQLMAATIQRPNTRWWLVTQRGAPCEDHPMTARGAALAALARCLLTECAAVAGGWRDVAPGDSRADILTGEPLGAVRGGALKVPRLRSVEESNAPSVDLPDTWILTGGTGSVGLHLAAELVEQGAKTLHLLSRRGEPADGTDAATQIAALRGSGAQICTHAVDVTDREALLSLTTAVSSDTYGVIHAAGVTRPTASGTLTRDGALEVLGPKRDGGQALNALFEHHRPAMVWTLGSIASVWGSKDLAAYAAANGWLEGWAHELASQGIDARCLQWGPWADSGMVDGETQRALEALGLVAHTPDAGRKALRTILRTSHRSPVLVRADWRTLSERLSAGPTRALLEDLCPSTTVPTTPVSPTHWTLTDATEAIAESAREVLRSAEPVDRQTPLISLGLDSLMATELRNLLAGKGLPVPLGRLLGGPSVDELATIAVAALERTETPSVQVEEDDVPSWMLWTHAAAILVGAAIATAASVLLRAAG